MKWILRLLTLMSMIVVLTIPLWMDRFFLNPQSQPASTPETGLLERLPSPARNTTVYKWQDDSGQWHYSDAPPTDARTHETLEVSSQTNIIQSTPVPEEKNQTAAQDGKPKPEKDQAGDKNQEDLFSLDRIQNILQETREVRDLMESRNRELEEITGSGE